MPIGSLAPLVFNQFFDNNGNPLAGGKLYSYLAGTLVPLVTSADVNQTVPNANPIVLNAAGRCGPIFLAVSSYKFILTDASDVVIASVDNVSSVDNHTGLVGFAGGLYSGNGGLNVGSGVAATLFAITPGLARRYEVSAAVSGAGVAYTAFATVVSDGTVARIVSNNGANLTLTLSGLNVQATQTSGVAQNINFVYTRLG